MNPADHTRYMLALAIATRIRMSPEEARKAINKIRANIAKLTERGLQTDGDMEWLVLLNSKTPTEIAQIIEDQSPESQRLRSNLRGNGIITDEERFLVLTTAYNNQHDSSQDKLT